MMQRVRGSSLIDGMLAASLSACAVLAAISMLQSANAAFVQQEQFALLQENGRYAIGIMRRILHQVAYVDHGLMNAGPNVSIDIQGLDNTGFNGSDELTLHFTGSGELADGHVINCAGFAIANANISALPDQGWSIFYVAKNSEGEPELLCKYLGATGWSSQALVAGVESFQVLYGVDTDADGIVNQYLKATHVAALSHWNRVVALRIALLLRAERDAGSSSRPLYYALFGDAYDAAADPGTLFTLNSLPAINRMWQRQVVQSTIYLRNTLAAGTALP